MRQDLAAKIAVQFEQLLADYQSVKQAHWNHPKGNGWYRFPPDDQYLRIRTQALNLTKIACGPDSEHFTQLRRLAEDKVSAHHSGFLANVAGVIEAAYRDFKSDLLFDTETRVRAELLDDFLSQAEGLLADKAHVAAVSLGGAVLEDTLRKLCDRVPVTYDEKTSIEVLNVALVKAGAYDKLVQKQVTAHADLRNKADHGRFAEVTAGDAGDFLRWLRRFVTERLRD